MMKISDTVKHLIIINIMFFITVKLLGYGVYDSLSLWFPENENFKVWQVFTHMFMHSSTFYLHIIMNMLGLWMFGSPLEQMWGRNKFLFFYFSAGLGAIILPFTIDYYQFNNYYHQLIDMGLTNTNILSILNTGHYGEFSKLISLSTEELTSFYRVFNTPSLGASGALMGLVSAFGINFPNAKMGLILIPVPIAAKYFIPVLLAYEILSGVFGWSSIFGITIGHFAHVGGAITGAIIAWYWKKNQFKTN